MSGTKWQRIFVTAISSYSSHIPKGNTCSKLFFSQNSCFLKQLQISIKQSANLNKKSQPTHVLLDFPLGVLPLGHGSLALS